MSLKSTDLDDLKILVNEIRKCDDCETTKLYDSTKRGTPFVFIGKHPQILVVSEIPYKKAWKKNEGKDWIDGKSFLPDNKKKGISNKLCEWLKINSDLLEEKVFWVQRANCCVEFGKEFVFQHCSEKFLRKIIQSLKPKLIITLGKTAAQYFFQFKLLSKLIQKEISEGLLTVNIGDSIYKFLVLPHPSGAAKKSQDVIMDPKMQKLLQQAKIFLI